MRVGGPAERLIELEPGDSLKTAVTAHAGGQLFVLGEGTNSLISDRGLAGTVIVTKGGTIEALGSTRLRVDSGVNWDDFIQECLRHQFYGLEFTSGIPGSVGGAICGNIAAYGHQVASCLVGATILDSKSGQVYNWQPSDLAFAYRHSSLQQPSNQHLVVLDGTFEFSPTVTSQLEYGSALSVAADLQLEPDTLEHRRIIILEARRRAGSLQEDSPTPPFTAGSFFLNPLVGQDQVEAIITHDESGISRQQLLRQNQIHGGSQVRVSAAHVLLAAGFRRGQTWGNVGLHQSHVLKVANLGNASAQEIYNVVQLIIKTVKEKLNIDLEPEVRLIGKF